MNDEIFETVITTVDRDGRPHIAPMGVRYRDGTVLLMPFKPSTTLDNIIATRHAVLNRLVDPRVFAGCVTGRKDWPTVPLDRGVRLEAALSHIELELTQWADDRARPVLTMACRDERQHRPFLGLNRAQAAVVEGAVLVSRLHMLPTEKVEAEMAYLQIAIDKTAGAEAHEAWGWLQQAVAAHRAARSREAAPRMKLLVSVRDVDEALAAASAGADLVDLKEPRKGALGGLPPEHIGLIVASLREAGWAGPISATIGDWSMDDPHGIVDRVVSVGERGVTYVKVGVEPAATTPVVLDVLASCGHAVVPVFIADRGLDLRLVERALARGFPAVMVDTADKRAGSLFDLARPAELRAFIDQARAAGAMVGLAGALQRQHLAALQSLAPDFAGFRSAVCGAGRESTFEPARLQALRAALCPAASAAR